LQLPLVISQTDPKISRQFVNYRIVAEIFPRNAHTSALHKLRYLKRPLSRQLTGVTTQYIQHCCPGSNFSQCIDSSFGFSCPQLLLPLPRGKAVFLRATALYAIACICHGNSVCLSVCPSVCPSHGWISQKRLKLGSRNFHRTVAPSL